ncbi:MAG TPA: hypothetical protein VHS26_02430 [Solirubrobacteraceae bacterium]|nr:hypothetical protein [Solirubrobacteraceae bacterium]
MVNGAPITRPTLDHWMEVAAAPGKASAASNQRYKMLETEVLGYLITADWLIGESASLSVKLSDAEVKHQLVREKLAEFPRAAQFEAYLHESRETVSDLLLNVKLHMLEQKLRTREKNGFTAFVKRLEKRWTARTECRAGYVVPDCREYRAPKAKG